MDAELIGAWLEASVFSTAAGAASGALLVSEQGAIVGYEKTKDEDLEAWFTPIRNKMIVWRCCLIACGAPDSLAPFVQCRVLRNATACALLFCRSSVPLLCMQRLGVVGMCSFGEQVSLIINYCSVADVYLVLL